MKLFQQGMALFLSWSLVLAGVQDGYAQAPAQALQQSPQQLQQLVAPIALYPDGLVAQILAGRRTIAPVFASRHALLPWASATKLATVIGVYFSYSSAVMVPAPVLKIA